MQKIRDPKKYQLLRVNNQNDKYICHDINQAFINIQILLFIYILTEAYIIS